MNDDPTLDVNELDAPFPPPTFLEARQAGTRNRLSEHFVIEEFDCRNGARVPRSHERALEYWCNVFGEPMRRLYGPATINSGYRTKAYNQQVGGAPGSYHVYDEHDTDDVAVDVRFRRGWPWLWTMTARRIRRRKRNGKGGIGRYPRSRGRFVHLDTRDYTSDWTG